MSKPRVSQSSTGVLRKRIIALSRLAGFWRYRAKRAEQKCITLQAKLEACRCSGP